MYPTQLHSYMLWRSSVEPTPPMLASKRYTAAISLIPAAMVGVFVYGWYAGLVVLTCLVSAFLADWLCRRFIFRREAELFGKRDGVWLLTGLLVAMMLPPALPLYLAAFGAIVAVLAGKYLLQVDGMPLFQPALLGLLALHIICPLIFAFSAGPSNATMMPRDRWPVLARGTSVETPGEGRFVPKFLRNFFGGDIRNSMDAQQYTADLFSNKTIAAEAVTGPRPQDLVAALPARDLSCCKQRGPNGESIEACDWLRMLLGYLPATIGGSQGLALLLGAFLVFFGRSNSPLIPFFTVATMLGGLLLAAWLGSGGTNPLVVFGNIPIHLLSGGTLLAVFYFACDPAVTPRSKRGKIYAGVFFGIIELVLRLGFKMSDGLPLSLFATQAMSFPIDQWLAPPDVGSASAVQIGITQSSLGRL